MDNHNQRMSTQSRPIIDSVSRTTKELDIT